MKRIIKFFLLMILLFTMMGCDKKKTSSDIVVTSFIGYDLATKVAGDKLTVDNILPFGSELHDFSPTPKDIIAVNNARLFIYLSVDLEPWVETNSTNPNALNLSESFTLAEHEHVTLDTDEDEHDHSSLHFWTDPTTYLQLINVVRDKLIALDAENKEYYTENAKAYYDEIYALHEEMDIFSQSIDKKELFFAGHNALDAFASRYHLTIHALTSSYQPDADLTPQQILDLKNAIKEAGVHYLFIEELQEPKIANTIKNSLKEEEYELELLELHGYHNISVEQKEANVCYADLLKQNIINIKKALTIADE